MIISSTMTRCGCVACKASDHVRFSRGGVISGPFVINGDFNMTTLLQLNASGLLCWAVLGDDGEVHYFPFFDEVQALSTRSCRRINGLAL
ncbi:hypothetical protein Ddc_22010 [Ditylenchus destructor]|nr:hypothetical protein Ddc_22010 [Ditylenchus destructor]